VSARLKEARETRNLSHRQIADTTKLSVHVIRALEEERVSALPPGIYRRALVRAFASEVGMDPEATLREYLVEYPDNLPPPGHVASVAEPLLTRRSSWRRLMAMLGAAVPILTGVAYFGTGGAPRAVEPLLEAPATATAREREAEVIPIGGFQAVPPRSDLPVTVMITVSSRCDLRVVADGELVVAGTLDAGESLQVAFSDELQLSGSDAGVIQYSINGRAGRLLGDAGQPLSARIGRENYPLFLSGR
jgi:transcriptional regulator with XRE-family HTH domain